MYERKSTVLVDKEKTGYKMWPSRRKAEKIPSSEEKKMVDRDSVYPL